MPMEPMPRIIAACKRLYRIDTFSGAGILPEISIPSFLKDSHRVLFLWKHTQDQDA
jgi:hypothetical protein